MHLVRVSAARVFLCVFSSPGEKEMKEKTTKQIRKNLEGQARRKGRKGSFSGRGVKIGKKIKGVDERKKSQLKGRKQKG